MKIKSILFTSLLAASLLVACGKSDKNDYKALYEAESIKTANKDFENNGLKLALASFDSRYKDGVDLEQYTIMSTGDVSFNDFNDSIYLSSKVKFQQQDAIQNSIKLNLINNISVSPTDSWTIKTNTARTDFSNKNGIYGNVEIYKIYDTVAAEFIYSNFMEPFLQANSLNSAGLQYLFIGSSKSGVEATSKVNITSTDTTLTTRSVDVNNLYDEAKLEEVLNELEKARKAKEENEKERLSLLEQELQAGLGEQETSEGGQVTSESEQETSESVEETTQASTEETSTEAAETGETSETGETTETNETTETITESSKTVEFIDVQVPEYKTTTNEYIFRVGIVMSGENAIVYKFLYRNDDNVSSNKEILDSLISSMQVDSMNISMEK